MALVFHILTPIIMLNRPTSEDLMNNEEFKNFSPSIIERAVESYKNPEEWLRRINSQIHEIMEEQEFQGFTESTIKNVVIRNKNPEAKLRKVIQN